MLNWSDVTNTAKIVNHEAHLGTRGTAKIN